MKRISRKSVQIKLLVKIKKMKVTSQSYNHPSNLKRLEQPCACEIFVRGYSRSVQMVEFDRPYMTSHQSAIVNLALSCTIFELFDAEEYRHLEI